MRKDVFWIEARNRRLVSAASLLREYEENRVLYNCFKRLKNRRLCTVIAELKMAKFIEENLC